MKKIYIVVYCPAFPTLQSYFTYYMHLYSNFQINESELDGYMEAFRT